MPRVIHEALQEPDTLATFAVLVVVAVIVAWWLAPRWSRPRWLVALATCSVAAIVAATAVPSGGWDDLGVHPGGLGDLAACLGPSGWRQTLGYPIAADTLLNVILYVPAGFLWVLVVRRPLLVIALLGACSLALESWQTWSGTRSCTTNDIVANTMGAALGVLAGWVVARLASSRAM